MLLNCLFVFVVLGNIFLHHKISLKIINPIINQSRQLLLSPAEFKDDLNEEPMCLAVEMESYEGDDLILNELYEEITEQNTEAQHEKFYSLAIKCCQSDNKEVIKQIFEQLKNYEKERI